MLKNIKIQRKLIICFMIVVFVSSISGLSGSILLLRTDKSYSKALVENGFSQGEIGAFNTYLNKGAAVLRDIIILTEDKEIKNSQLELNEIDKETIEALEDLKKNCKTEDEIQLIKIIEENYPKFNLLRGKIVTLGLANKNKEALEYFHDTARPVLNEIMNAAQQLADLNSTMGKEVSDYLSKQNTITLIVILLIIIVSVISSILFANIIAKDFAISINQVNVASKTLAQGELKIDITADSKDEIGEMTDSFHAATIMLQSYIDEIKRVLLEVSQGNFDVRHEIEFQGDFLQIEDVIHEFLGSLSDTLEQIQESSGQVDLGAAQLAESAQSLAEGATDQAGAIEELQATVIEVIEQAKRNAKENEMSYHITNNVSKEASASSLDMDELIKAMEHINSTSNQIRNIISEIEDIASQTNLLSLNAAIEAARAGEAGKGFAVVADQIRQLAESSAKSAVNTREMIETSLREVDAGNQMTERTVCALKKVINDMDVIAEKVKESSEVSNRQVDYMQQIGDGINQISSVVQNNSAVAEETSATSEELSAQSNNLSNLISQFKLRKY